MADYQFARAARSTQRPVPPRPVQAQLPIGSIVFLDSDADPATTFGYGEWERFAIGRTVLGVDETDADYDTPLEFGGSK